MIFALEDGGRVSFLLDNIFLLWNSAFDNRGWKIDPRDGYLVK